MEEVVGRNPRFMQDPQSDRGAVVEMGQAINEGRATVVEVINMRKDGSRFWNQVSKPAELHELFYHVAAGPHSSANGSLPDVVHVVIVITVRGMAHTIDM